MRLVFLMYKKIVYASRILYTQKQSGLMTFFGTLNLIEPKDDKD